MKYQSGYSCLAFFISCAFSVLASADLPDLAPPKVQLVDEYGINMVNGQVQSNLETVAIGGGMGLSHSISSHTNNFSITGYRGYQDKYYAKGRVAEIDINPFNYKNVMRVHDISGSADFELIVNGNPVNFNSGVTSNYTYRALGDKRHKLERRSDGVYWTKPDGTVVRFEGGSDGHPDHVGLMKQIQYPNGFTIDIDYLAKRITTNTGFAIKYIHEYDPDDEFMDPAKNITNSTEVPAVNAETWAARNPKYVEAINTSVEDCLTSSCVTDWPKAEFDWPAGMPRAIYLGDSTFKVIDAMGGVTEYYFRGFDLAYNGDTLYEHSVPLRNYSPRLIGIKPAGSEDKVFQYTYENIFNHYSSQYTTWFFLGDEAGRVIRAQRYDEISGYSIGEAYYDDVQNSAGGYIQRVLPTYAQYPGAINQVTTREGTWHYEQNFRNFPVSYSKNTGMVEAFGYDGRGNMNLHTRGGVSVSASYPEECDLDNFKYCNKPTWTRDGKGNQTDYEYHKDSGQVERVTYPANKNGIRAETRYKYEQKYANYFNASGVEAEAAIPVWLKTEERYCINSNASDGVCSGNDEVVTRYEYEHDNLFLTGITVTNSQGKTLRTCYQYDIYGNRIGETQPKANLSSCNQQGL